MRDGDIRQDQGQIAAQDWPGARQAQNKCKETSHGKDIDMYSTSFLTTLISLRSKAPYKVKRLTLPTTSSLGVC